MAVLGFTDINTPTIGGMIYWANQHTAMVAGIWWWIAFPTIAVIMTFIGLFLLAVSMNEYIDPRSRFSRMRGRAVKSATASRATTPDAARPILVGPRSQALFRTRHFGVKRDGEGGRRDRLRDPAAARSTVSPANPVRARPR